MAVLEQSSQRPAVQTRKRPMALLIVAAMATFTVSTPFPLLFGVIPRPSLIAVVFTIFMFVSLAGKVGRRYWQFALAYLAAFVPATLYNFYSTVKWSSVLQMLAMLVTFCVLATYFERWLSRNSDEVKARWLQALLLYFFVLSGLEMIYPPFFSGIREQLYPAAGGEFGSMLNSYRELSIYGGRPYNFFSEPSNFAKALSIIVAAYMTVTKCSKRSILALIAFYLMVRSVSYFYAAPAMVFAWWRPSWRPRSAKRRRPKSRATKLLITAAVGACLLVSIFLTQQTRIGNAISGQDNSLSGRIGLPLKYMFTHADRLVMGDGLTPQDELMNYTVMTYAMSSGSLSSLTYVMPATSTTITFLVGVGLIGLVTFYVAIFLMQRGPGAWLVTAFLVSNIINAGYNSSTTFVLSALLLSLLVYQFSSARGQQRQIPADNALAMQRAG